MSAEERPAERVEVYGFTWSPRSHDVKDFLARSRTPYAWMDYETHPESRRKIADMGLSQQDLPVLVFPDGTHLTDPPDEVIAEKIGLSTEASYPFYDLIVVGGGPAGLAAAVYGASEGMRVVVLEREAPGGQAGMSASIENYLGFPEGLSGGELAQRATRQAERFGAEVIVAREVRSLRVEEPYRVVTLDDGTELFGYAVLLATGVADRVLDAPGCQSLVGRGIYYGAAAAEASACHDRDVHLVGAGNSAGQAAVLLARFARSVTLIAPEESFAERMSEYLLERIEATENIHLRPGAVVSGATGSDHLEEITIEEVSSRRHETTPSGGLFVFIGAAPDTAWLEGVVARDERGFIRSGWDVLDAGWPRKRHPAPLETNVPGVFVAGDVRSGSVKRVGSAVGEGSMVIQHVHAYLNEA